MSYNDLAYDYKENLYINGQISFQTGNKVIRCIGISEV